MATTTVITAGQFIVPGYPFGTATALVGSLTSMPGGKTKVTVGGMTLLSDVLQGGTGVNFENPATFGGIAPDNSASGGPTVIAGVWPTTTVEPVQQTPIMNYCVIDTNVGLEIYKIVTVLSDTEFVIQGTVPAPATTVLFLADKAYGATSVAITCTAGYLMGGLDQALVTMPAGSVTVGYGDDRVDPFLVGSIATDVTITLDAMVLGGTGGGGGGGAVNSVTATAPITSSGGANPNIAMPAATALANGYLTSGDWTTFNSKQNALTFGSISTTTGGVTIGSGNNSTVGPNVTVDIATASALATGLLSSADWSTFNGKQNALSFGNLTEATSSVLTITGGTGSVIGGGTTIQVKQAGAGQDGFLSSADWSTFNSKQSALTFSTGLTNAAGTVTANLSTGVAGGQSVIGGTAASNSLTLSSTSNATKGKILFGTSAYDEVNNRLGIGTASPATPLHVVGRLTVSQDTTVATQTSAVITTDTANCSIVLRPTGTGAIIAQIPDGTATGGNARGQYAVDLQMTRSGASQVASGNYSGVLCGSGNSATTDWSCVASGQTNLASGSRAFVGGGQSHSCSGDFATIAGGSTSTASGINSSISGGRLGYAYLYGQRANASGSFSGSVAGDSQTSAITYRRSITGTAQTELFLDGSSTAAILNISSPGPTNGRLWNAYIQVTAICQTQGNGTVTVGESLIGNYMCGIKRIGTSTSLVGTVQTIHTAQTDTNMSTSVVTIDANDTNESLRIQFTPPSTAGSTTVIRVVATAYLTEVGY